MLDQTPVGSGRVVIRNFEGKVFEYPEAGQRQPVPANDELDSVGLWKD